MLNRQRSIVVAAATCVLVLGTSRSMFAQSEPGDSPASPQALPLPQGSGSVEGMGESVETNPSTGALSVQVPLDVPEGRAGLRPNLALVYSSLQGSSEVGVGWSLGVPSIARQTQQGLTQYAHQVGWHIQEDRFVSGNRELVPISSASMSAVDGSVAPDWSICLPASTASTSCFQEYRFRHEGAFQRFFRSADSTRWIVVDRDGMRYDYGQLPSGDGPVEITDVSVKAIQQGPQGQVFRWFLTRISDAHGSTLYYSYGIRLGQHYLQSIHYVSPESCSNYDTPTSRRQCDAPLSSYGVHARFLYEDRPDHLTSYTPGWAVTTDRRLRRIEITAAEGATGARSLVRRYHLSYAADSFHSLLATIQMEARPEDIDDSSGSNVGELISENVLGDDIVGTLLPPMSFAYQSAAATTEAVPGFGGLAETQQSIDDAPNVSLANDQATDEFVDTRLMDVNADGLPDIIRLSESGAAQVRFNGFAEWGEVTFGARFSEPVAIETPDQPESAAALHFGNEQLLAFDVEGDGRVDMMHFDAGNSYGPFFVARETYAGAGGVSPSEQGWRFVHLKLPPPVSGAPQQQLDTDDRYRAIDVNDDHLVDIVFNQGGQLRTWLNLSRFEGGMGRFGRMDFTAGSAVIDENAPFEETDGIGQSFASGVRFGELNGDGLPDLVLIEGSSVEYWPSRGLGHWGADDVPGGSLELPLTAGTVSLSNAIRLADVNADGLDDLVTADGVSDKIRVWFNAIDEFRGPIAIHLTPGLPGGSELERLQLVDIDGSGTVDVLLPYANNWRFLDLMGGVRPRLLVHIDNGLGAVTSVAYESSSIDRERDLRAAQSCAGRTCDAFDWSEAGELCDALLEGATDECLVRSGSTPLLPVVVRSTTTSDQFGVLGVRSQVAVTEYRYHNPYYDGVEHEFRGFAASDVIHRGSPVEPTAVRRTRFHQGRRSSAVASDPLTSNPDDALSGRRWLEETRDENHVYLSTKHTSWAVRSLATGLDGREVTWAYPIQVDVFHYDNAPFEPALSLQTLPQIRYEDSSGSEVAELAVDVQVAIRGQNYARTRETIDQVSSAGHLLTKTAWGRIEGEFGESIPDERIVQRTQPVLLEHESGWRWVTQASWIEDAAGRQYGHTEFVHDPITGDVLSSQQQVYVPDVIAGLPDSFDFGGYGTAPGFTDASEARVSSSSYDPWGNPLLICAGASDPTSEQCLRRSAIRYDEDYGWFAVEESVAVRKNQTGFSSLIWTETWDRGLGAPTARTDPNGLTTEIGYDGAGRLTFVRPPPSQGCMGSTVPTLRVAYELTSDPSAMPVNSVRTYREMDCTAIGAETIETIEYVDGLGRTRASLSTAEAGHRFVRSNVATFTKRGSLHRTLESDFYDVATPSVAEVLQLSGAYTEQRYDAFGRVLESLAQDGAMSRTWHHALSTDVCDPLDQDPTSLAYQTCLTERMDGHGRLVDRIHRNRQPSSQALEIHRLWRSYRADGLVVSEIRAQTSDDHPMSASNVVDDHWVERLFVWDSVGQLRATYDPNLDSLAPTATAANRGYRYLYNRVGDRVAMRDPRGCGSNSFYDRVGRLIGERFVSCEEAGSPTTLPSEVVPDDAISLDVAESQPGDVRYYYDMLPDWAADEDVPPMSFSMGRPTGSLDRAQRSVVSHDARGNPNWMLRQMAWINDPPSDESPWAAEPTVYDDSHDYVRAWAYDHGDRLVSGSLPIDPDFGEGGLVGPTVSGTLSYNQRGLPRGATLDIDGQAFPVIHHIGYTADGLEQQVVYGDAQPGHGATTTQTLYDVRRRPKRMRTLRNPGPIADNNPLSHIQEVAHQRFHWDAADNLTAIEDLRSASAWPEGHRPANIFIQHDALYRAVEMQYVYLGEDGTPVIEPTSDWRDELLINTEDGINHVQADPMRARPAPRVSDAETRVAQISYRYDFLGNSTEFFDDQHSFYERSLGLIRNGIDEPGDRPAAIRFASDLPPALAGYFMQPDSTQDRGGWLKVEYGQGGNVLALTVHGRCHDTAEKVCFQSSGVAVEELDQLLENRCSCDTEQRYEYEFDELNRLVGARRFDRSNGGGWNLAVRHRYLHDADGQRLIKRVSDDALATPGEPDEKIALYVYPDDFERRGLVRDLETNSYQATSHTETQYLVGGARIVWKAIVGSTSDLDPSHRITIPIGDLLGTTTGVIDLLSGELIETRTYYPNGAPETLLAQHQVGLPIDPSGFTGLEADSAVGLTMAKYRALLSHLGRWASPDPLYIEANGGGEALNPFHYVSGNLLQASDPLGLQSPQAVNHFDSAGNLIGVDDPDQGSYPVPAQQPVVPSSAPSAESRCVNGPCIGSGGHTQPLTPSQSHELWKADRADQLQRERAEARRDQFRTTFEILVTFASFARPRGRGPQSRTPDPGREALVLIRDGGSAANRALHERYVDGLRAAMERPHVYDTGLSGTMHYVYRPGATIGSGSTAAAARLEMAQGVRVGGRLHTQKAQESITRLQRWLDRNPTARPGDRAAAENVGRDLQNALGGN